AGLLRQLRGEAELTQEELAAAAGVSARSVSDLERGITRTARLDTARLLAGALGLAGPARVAFVAAGPRPAPPPPPPPARPGAGPGRPPWPRRGGGGGGGGARGRRPGARRGISPPSPAAGPSWASWWGRWHAGDAAVREITRLCGYLPLAIGMLASQLRHHPT